MPGLVIKSKYNVLIGLVYIYIYFFFVGVNRNLCFCMPQWRRQSRNDANIRMRECRTPLRLNISSILLLLVYQVFYWKCNEMIYCQTTKFVNGTIDTKMSVLFYVSYAWTHILVGNRKRLWCDLQLSKRNDWAFPKEDKKKEGVGH